MGNVRFQDEKVLFVSEHVAMHDDCCCAEPEYIEGTCCGDDCDTMPKFLQVVLSGITRCGDDFEGTYGSCCCDGDTWDGTYILELRELP